MNIMDNKLLGNNNNRTDLAGYTLSFLIPFMILIVNMYMLDILPMGDKTVFMWDALYQYKDYFGYLWDLLHGNADVQYAVSKSLGGNFQGIFGFYCSSPLNLILFFFQKNSIALFMSLMILLRISLCGLSCNYYLKKRFHSPLIWSLVLSSSYALMEYNVYYCRNCMWLDGVIMLPLVALGIWNVLEDKGVTLLWISTGLAIVANWYSAYMVCLMSGFLFIIEYFLKYDYRILDSFKDGGVVKIKNYVLGIMGGVTAGAIILVPACMALLNGKASNNRTLFSSVINFDFLHFLSGFDISSQVYSTVEPILYCSFFLLVLCIYFFFCHHIETKKKCIVGIFMAFLIGSFCFRQMELIWTLFIESHSFFYRFAFVFGFIMVWISALTINEILLNGIDWKALVKTVGIIIIIAYLLARSGELFSKPKILICSLFCILFYGGVLYVIGNNKVHHTSLTGWMLSVAVLSLVCCELAYNTRLAFAHYDKSGRQFSEYEKEMEELISYMDHHSKQEYYRFEKNDNYVSLNGEYVASCEPMFYHYNSLEHYSSSYDPDVSFFLANVGYANWIKDSTFLTETYWNSPMIAMEALLSEKYILWNKGTFGYKKELDNPISLLPNRHLYESSYYLPLGYNVARTTGEINYGPNPFENQNRIYSALLGIPVKLYSSVDVSSYDMTSDCKEEHWTLRVKGDGPVYLYPDGKQALSSFYVDNGEILVNGQKIQAISKRSLINVILAGEYHKGDKIQVTIKRYNGNDQSYRLYASQMDTEVFRQAISRLKKGYRSSICIRGNKVEGTYQTEQDTTLLLSVPYEKNWKIYVDGKKVHARKLLGIFTGLDLKAGNHKISMVYQAAGVLSGRMISGLSLLILVCYSVLFKRNKKFTR